MAPLHHHFELKGYPETKVTGMYMIITFVLLPYIPFNAGLKAHLPGIGTERRTYRWILKTRGRL